MVVLITDISWCQFWARVCVCACVWGSNGWTNLLWGTSSEVVEHRFEPILSRSKAIILTTVLCCFPVDLRLSNILSDIFHKTSKAELFWLGQGGSPGITTLPHLQARSTHGAFTLPGATCSHPQDQTGPWRSKTHFASSPESLDEYQLITVLRARGPRAWLTA